MYQRRRQRNKRTPLLVKEIILPCGDDNSGLGRNSTFRNNSDKGGTEIPVYRYRKMGGQNEPEEVLNLMVLQEKPLENYFEGTRKGKKVRKRKRKNCRTVIPPSKFFSDGGQPLSEGERKQTDEEGLTDERTQDEKTEVKLLALKIYEFEKKREQEYRENLIRQRMAKEAYISQLESLTAKWFKTKKRSATKEVNDNKVLPESHPKETPRKGIMEKTACRKSHSENSESQHGKSKKVFEMSESIRTQSMDEVLGDEFYAKLVFVDEDSDESDYKGQRLQFRRNLRKH